MHTHRVQLAVNGKLKTVTVPADERLLDTLRTKMDLYGARYGCGTGHCGACVVSQEGVGLVPSCLMLTVRLDGAAITTYEGLETDPLMRDLQDAFVEEGAAQCGYCTPGILLSLHHVLSQDPVDENVVRESLVSHLCRCTGHYASVRAAMKVLQRKAGMKVAVD